MGMRKNTDYPECCELSQMNAKWITFKGEVEEVTTKAHVQIRGEREGTLGKYLFYAFLWARDPDKKIVF